MFASCAFVSANEAAPHSADFFARGVCLPSGSGMAEEELAFVAQAVRAAFT
jgi:dTDP-4-amino-4,6-dideoxygalactose transaminase